MLEAQAYFAAEKRLSNEFADTIGWAPATMLSRGGGRGGRVIGCGIGS